MAATWAAQTNTTPSLEHGDPLLALWLSVAVQLDFLQAQAQLVLALSRAQTSTGADLDSWMAQFGLARLPATFATGEETFSTAFPVGTSVIIPVGVVVQTVGAGVQYQVIADPANSNYNAAANGYVLAAGQTTTTATVQALVAGSGGNVGANLLTQFGSSLPGISTATNPSPINNGIDAEPDSSFRSRFVLYLATLAKATKAALLAAAGGVQQGLSVTLLENQQPGGIPLLGSFTAIIDDGTGSPSFNLLNTVFNAIDQTRAFTVQPFVVPPTTALAVIQFSARIASGFTAAAVIAAIQNAVADMVNALPPGGALYGSAIIQAALTVSGVTSVDPTTLLINGSPSDLAAPTGQEIKTTADSISVAQY